MKRHIVTAIVVALTLVAVAVLGVPASAHETSEVGGLAVEIGWGTEPAYVGQLNSVQVIVTYKADGDPVEDAGAALEATLTYGTETTTLELVPNFDVGLGGIPGEYRALLIPTAPGDYTFHITGTVDGVEVDKEVTSSPKTFSPVEDVSAAQFPVKAPTTAELADRLDAELARIAADSQASGGESQESTGDSQSSMAVLLAVAGIVVGGIGLAVATVALLRRRA